MIKEEHQSILLSSIAYARGFIYNKDKGLIDSESGNLITDDKNQIAKHLLGQTADSKDIELIERTINFIKKLPNYKSLIEYAEKELSPQGIKFPDSTFIETYRPGTSSWMRALMDVCK